MNTGSKGKLILVIGAAVLIAGALAVVTAFLNKRDSAPVDVESPATPQAGVRGEEGSDREVLTTSYPNDFLPQPGEVPTGFELEVLDERAQGAGVTGNPGYLNNPEFIQELYENVDASKIEQVYFVVYVQPERPSTELGVFIVKYRSAADLTSEQAKMKPERDRVYLVGQDILTLVWSDSEEYAAQMQKIVSALKSRLDLTEL